MNAFSIIFSYIDAACCRVLSLAGRAWSSRVQRMVVERSQSFELN